jgi:3'(2'), 5'-bisphosphate nucleotidase
MYYAEGKKNPSKLNFNHRTFSSTKSSSIMKASSSSSSLSSSVSNNEINEQETETTMKSLPESHPYISEIKPALSAIRKACRITTYLQPNTANTNISGLNKKDASPVTIGDFAVQGLVLNMLEKEFENNIFIAEEGSKNLTPDDNGDDDDDDDDALSLEILDVMKECQFDSIIGNVNELKRSIDLGQTYEQNGEFKEEVIRNQKDMKGPIRTWCLDPIDGTRGFLRGKREGGQYCIALALIEVS